MSCVTNYDDDDDDDDDGDDDDGDGDDDDDDDDGRMTMMMINGGVQIRDKSSTLPNCSLIESMIEPPRYDLQCCTL